VLLGPRHTTGLLKKEKQRLSSIIDDLDAPAQVCLFSIEEIELKSQSNTDIAKLLPEEVLKWYQWCKTQIYSSRRFEYKILLLYCQ
jgi:hypothetical protein